MICMHHTFNGTIDEFQRTLYMITTTLSTNVDEQLKIMEDLVNYSVTQVKDHENTINLLE